MARHRSNGDSGSSQHTPRAPHAPAAWRTGIDERQLATVPAPTAPPPAVDQMTAPLLAVAATGRKALLTVMSTTINQKEVSVES
jgi:hypothetical protein